MNTAENTNLVDLDKAAAVQDPNTITLDTPIKRGQTEITKITLRKPTAGELRGTTLQALANSDVDALAKVLPRISNPTLTDADVSRMDPADLMQLAGVFSGFLLPKAMHASLDYPSA